MDTEIETEDVTPETEVPEPELEQTEVIEPEQETPEVTEPEEDEHKSGFERKVKKLTQKAKEAEQAAQYWYNEAVKHQQPKTQEKETNPEPKFSDYNDIDAFGKAMGRYQAELAVKAALAEREQAQGSTSLLRAYNERLTSFKKETPDFDEVFEDLDIPMPEDLMQGILESDEGPRIAYYLAKNTKEVQRLNNLSPHRRLIELGKLETKLQKTEEKKPDPVKKISSAPAGIKTPNSSTTTVKDGDNLSGQDWINWRNEQERKRGRRA